MEWDMRQTTKSAGEKIVKYANLAKVAPKALAAYITGSKLRGEPPVRPDSYY